MDHKTLFPLLEMGFFFLDISKIIRFKIYSR